MIIIKKGARMLYLIRRGKTLFECPVMLGEHPVGHKQTEGDGKTPEGSYRVCGKNPKSKFHKSLGISYPNAKDARAAYKLKRIKLKELCLISFETMLRLRPKWNSPLGGFIMLHGEAPDGKSGDWTKGCVAMKNEHIDALYSLARYGEKVVIEP